MGRAAAGLLRSSSNALRALPRHARTTHKRHKQCPLYYPHGRRTTMRVSMPLENDFQVLAAADEAHIRAVYLWLALNHGMQPTGRMSM